MIKLVIIGGGIAGTRLAQDLSKFNAKELDIKLIDKKDYFEIPYATLRGIIDPYNTGKTLRKLYRDFLKVEFILNKVIDLNADKVILEHGDEISYDIVVIATGSSYRSFSIPKPSEMFAKLSEREKQFQEEHLKLVKAKEVLIIGGGAVGVELAGDIAYFYPEKCIYLIEAFPRLLNELKPKAGKIAKKQLIKMGVKIILNEMIEQDSNGFWISKTSGNTYNPDIVYPCIGISPNTTFMESHFFDAIADNKQIIVNKKLQLNNYSNIYAIGDCNDVKESKLGYFADKQAQFLIKNFKKLIRSNFSSNTHLRSYKPKLTISIVPIGKKKGIVQLPVGVFKLKALVAYKNKDLFVKRQFKKLKTVPNQI